MIQVFGAEEEVLFSLQSGGISVGHVCRPLYMCVYVSTFGGPRETRQYSEPYGLWQPRFRENLCLEVPSSLIFNVSPGAPRQHMFPACPQDMAASVRSTLARRTNASSHGYRLPHSFTSRHPSPPLNGSPETDGRKLQWQLCLFKSTPTQYPPVTNMTKSLIGVA